MPREGSSESGSGGGSGGGSGKKAKKRHGDTTEEQRRKEKEERKETEEELELERRTKEDEAAEDEVWNEFQRWRDQIANMKRRLSPSRVEKLKASLSRQQRLLQQFEQTEAEMEDLKKLSKQALKKSRP